MDSDALSFVSTFDLRQAPAEVIAQAKRSLLDLIGVAAAGSALDASRICRDFAADSYGPGARNGLFLFDGRRASPVGAGLANGTTIDAFDAHDGHPLTKGHAGCGSLAAVLAFCGCGEDVSGRDFLAHLVVGYEVSIRAGIALHATACDYHTSGAWVAIGAAAIASRMRGLDRARMREAFGIAEYNGPRSQMMRCIDHPTMIKDGSGWGAMTGIASAMMAEKGFTGAPAISVEAADVRAIWEDIGTRWRLLEQYYKPYPVCRWAQPAMEAVAQLRRDNGFSHEDIESLTVRTFTEASRLATAAPASSDAAQYSLPFPVAALLVRGRVAAEDISGAALADPDILRIARSVALVDDPRFSARFPAERWAEADILLRDGRLLKSAPAVARGSAENPLSQAEIGAKFHGLMQSAGFGDRAAAIEDAVMDIESRDTLSALLRMITQPTGSTIRA